VPSNDKEALSSSLMSLFEKRRCQKFFKFAQKFDLQDPTTHKYLKENMTFQDLTSKYGLENNTLDFLGHAVALYTDNSFKTEPAVKVLEKIKLYMDSVGRFGESPFIYPVYGLSGIPESFSRKSAVYGGTYMLSVKVNKLEKTEDKKFKLTGTWNG
jgi:Rab GDP dissociation inhibitor